jgi:cell division protein FtsL
MIRSETAAYIEPAKGRLGMGLIGLIVLGLTTIATIHVAVHAKRIETAIALGKEQRLYRELTEHRRQLEIEKGMLRDPRRLTQLARTELGMGPVDPGNIRSLQALSLSKPGQP